MLTTIIAIITAIAVIVKIYKDILDARRSRKDTFSEQSLIEIPTPKEVSKYSRPPTAAELRKYFKDIGTFLASLTLVQSEKAESAVTKDLSHTTDQHSRNYLLADDLEYPDWGEGPSRIGNIVAKAGLTYAHISHHSGLMNVEIVPILRSERPGIDAAEKDQLKILAAIYEIAGYRVSLYEAFPKRMPPGPLRDLTSPLIIKTRSDTWHGEEQFFASLTRRKHSNLLHRTDLANVKQNPTWDEM